MKLSFWTLGMPAEWTNQDTANNAARFGYDGVDLRCTRPDEHGRPSDAGNLCIASPDVQAIGDLFRSKGVVIPTMLAYNSGGHGKSGGTWEDFRKEVVAHAQVAKRLGAPRVRLTISQPPEGSTWETYLEEMGRVVLTALDETPGVSAIFENHVGAASAEQLLAMCAKVGDPRLSTFFSPDHCLVMQEDILGLIDKYTPQIGQVCFADRKLVQEDLGKFDGRFYYLRYESCGNGEGNVPARAMFERLEKQGYDGWVSLKWEKSARFGHHLPSGDVELPHFIEYMKSIGVTSTAGATR